MQILKENLWKQRKDVKIEILNVLFMPEMGNVIKQLDGWW
jgi:hypothetical protein